MALRETFRVEVSHISSGQTFIELVVDNQTESVVEISGPEPQHGDDLCVALITLLKSVRPLIYRKEG